MRILLDTHVALWFWAGSPRCPAALVKLIEDPENEVAFHQVSALEIQLKFQQGKLPLPRPPEQFVPEAVRQACFTYQPITDAAIYFLGKLPPLHRDPFDRLLIAHAVLDGCTIATLDRHIRQYAVATIGE